MRRDGAARRSRTDLARPAAPRTPPPRVWAGAGVRSARVPKASSKRSENRSDGYDRDQDREVGTAREADPPEGGLWKFACGERGASLFADEKTRPDDPRQHDQRKECAYEVTDELHRCRSRTQ